MKPVELVLRKGEERTMKRIKLRYIKIPYINITVYPSVQLLYANKTTITLKLTGMTICGIRENIYKE
jgi:hypothetical protein